ncbi:thioredoxin 2 [Caulobacter ginsengisoli]|uniref:Thioredoxin 2 n=1 Tax=Caulobacter ginsengisoli TaxID=400775 RepID=A0ABU0J0J6_9CAUL|nr:thioredoxin TrxC [Caulobacter ginsengisoli]MDQ0466742.1 thioredoxin 2 [Caulobacter ginsengisoli]
MTQTVCPHCDTTNRLPDSKPALQGKCGRCGQPLYVGQPKEVTGAGLARRMAAEPALLVDVWAPWCGPCRAMAPNFAAAAARLEPDVRLLKLNSEAEPAAAQRFNVSSIPALLLIKDGQVAARTAGLMSAEQIVGWARQALG